MKVIGTSLFLAALCATSAEAKTPASACELLTVAEVKAATGWKAATQEAKTYDVTSTCSYSGRALEGEFVFVGFSLEASPRKIATSAAFAEKRIAQGKRTPALAAKVVPIEGLDAPAIRVDDGSEGATIEAMVGGRLVSVTAPTIEAAQALARRVIARMR